jgi:uncharacterized membrane protein
MISLTDTEKRFLQSMIVLSGLCIAFVAVRIFITQTSQFLFLPENLALAWLGLIFSWLLVRRLKNHRWLSLKSLGLTFLWFVFLPNTWYVLTDFIHVYDRPEISQLYDIAMMTALVINGFILGFTSLYLVHKQLLKRLSETKSFVLVGLTILFSSFAIYLGRDLRWNTWDVIAHPAGIIINVTDRIIDPLGHPRAVNVTALFFVLISTLYFAIWLFVRPDNSRSTPK